MRPSSEDSEHVGDTDVAPRVAPIPAETPPEAAASTETTDKKTDSVLPDTPRLDPRNAVHKLGALGEELWRWFPQPETRAVVNALVKRRHGREVLTFIVGQLKAQGLTPPAKVTTKKATARLALPWLHSPLADNYDLTKPSGLAKLAADIEIIRRVCPSIFAAERPGYYDRANRCAYLLNQERARPALEAQEKRVAAVREAERNSVNPGNHPPIIVCGEVLWPDGDLPEYDRLTYDEARWAFFFWDHWGGALKRLMGSEEANSFWRQRISAFTGLNAPRLRAVAQFWMRCVRAFEANPEGESRCQFIDRTV